MPDGIRSGDYRRRLAHLGDGDNPAIWTPDHRRRLAHLDDSALPWVDDYRDRLAHLDADTVPPPEPEPEPEPEPAGATALSDTNLTFVSDPIPPRSSVDDSASQQNWIFYDFFGFPGTIVRADAIGGDQYASSFIFDLYFPEASTAEMLPTPVRAGLYPQSLKVKVHTVDGTEIAYRAWLPVRDVIDRSLPEDQWEWQSTVLRAVPASALSRSSGILPFSYLNDRPFGRTAIFWNVRPEPWRGQGLTEAIFRGHLAGSVTKRDIATSDGIALYRSGVSAVLTIELNGQMENTAGDLVPWPV